MVGVGMKRSGIRTSCVTGRTSWTGVGSLVATDRSLLVSGIGLPGRIEVRVRIADRREIRRARAGLQFLEQCVMRRLRLELRNGAIGIVHVPEHDGFGRASLLTGGHDLAI